MGICYSASKSKSGDGLWDSQNDSKRTDSKLRKNSYSGDFSNFFSKLSGIGGGGAEDQGLQHIPGRLLGNGATSFACLYTKQGKKGTNQDAMIVWENFCSRSDTIFCGVFDGHGPYGHMVARKVRDTLPLLLRSEWEVKSSGDENNTSENGNTNEGSHLDDVLDDDLIEAMEAECNEKFPEIRLPLKRSMLKAFRSMDKELKLNPTIDCFCSGSTAVSLVMQGQDIIVGNVGDSRAVLATRDKDNYLMAVQLTVDLKPNLPREAARIHKYKGRVFSLQDEPEVARVWLPNSDTPGLAMARAFGDFCLKDFGLISVPDVYYHRTTDRDEFVVLATDGVWDVLSNKEAVDIVASAPSRATAARALVDCATRAWRLKYPTSKTDDCAVVCLFLDRVPAPDAVVTAMQHDLTKAPEVEMKTIITDGNLESADSNSFSASHIAVLEHSGATKDASEIVPVDESIDEQLADKGLGHSKRSLSDCLSTAQDEVWSALEGITRVNSLLSLPRSISGEKRSASRRK